MKFKGCSFHKVNGTSLLGHLDVSYDDLVKVFGDPDCNGDGYKVDAEWALEFEDGTVATIYNYKDGKNYLGEEGLDVKDIRDWHIGGHNPNSVACVKAAIDAQKEKT